MACPRVFCFWVLFFVFQLLPYGCFGCLEKERSALLELKSSLNYPNGTSLSSWKVGTDCCSSWDGVGCNSSTGRVFLLAFIVYSTRDEALGLGDWYLNASLLLPFEELKSLYLDTSLIRGFKDEEALKRLSKLSELTLSRYGNQTDVPYLGAFKYLKNLVLGCNGFGFCGQLPIEGLTTLSRLEELEIRGFDFDPTHLKALSLTYNRHNHSQSIQGLCKLKNLQKLVLHDNNIDGTIPTCFGNLTKLWLLDLSYNVFSENIPTSQSLQGLCKLKNLQTLFLRADNNIDGTISTCLGNLTNLKYLDLSMNRFNGNYTTLSIQELCTLKKLQKLVLTDNNVEGTIPTCFGNFSNLRRIDLSSNVFSAKIPTSQSLQGLCTLKNLQKLVFTDNNIEGTIPTCFENLTNLKLLDLSNNGFSGKIPTSLMASLNSLVYFSLANNRLSGLFMIGSLAHLSKLKGFQLNDNDLEVETEYPPWNSTIQLEILDLSNCKLNKRTGVMPNFLYGQHDLALLDLSHNQLSGKFPTWLLENNTRLEILYLKNNSLSGTFHLPLHANISVLWISDNLISGQLPSNIGTLLPNLDIFNLSKNSFQGSIPPSMGDMASLQTLDLSHNNLSGEIPEHLLAGCVSLGTLKLSNNSLYGKLPSTYVNSTGLTSLYLDNNHFVGSIPPSLFNISNLQRLNIGDNYISGRIPSQVGDVSQLSTLVLRGNQFDGVVPSELCNLWFLGFLDLSDNSLSGPIPACINFTDLLYMHLEKNAFFGSIPSALSGSSSIISLDIRENKIFGVIPSWIERLSKLRILLLKENNLHGHIPIELCQLKNLSLLDLSHNSLSGSLPSCINNLTFGRLIFRDDAYRIHSGGYSEGAIVHVSPSETYDVNIWEHTAVIDEITAVEFITKSRTNSYKGSILNYMSGIDFSCNNLTGEIPLEMGQLSGLHSLNLSHNQFTGPIPVTFKNLCQIESLDLSYNRLSGTIPSELTELYFLSVFSVAHNNLSGRTPDRKSQFATFEQNSYDGNALLCGPPLNKSCTSTTHTIQAPEEEDDSDDSLDTFYASFVGSYVVFLLGTIAVLYFTSQRHAICFFHIVDSWCAFRLYRLLKLFNCK